MVTSEAVLHVKRHFGKPMPEIFETIRPMFPDLNMADMQTISQGIVDDLHLLGESRREYLGSDRLKKYANNLLLYLEKEPDLDIHARIRIKSEYERVVNTLA